MCDMIALSFAHPVAANIAIGPFGGHGEANPHGWGLAWYPDQSVAIVKEPVPWGESAHTAFLQSYPELRSCIYLFHVRHKTVGGDPTHADTHPFARELLGRDYCFAHNGTLKGVIDEQRLGRFHPNGATDSEHFFCHLLGELAQAVGKLTSPESWHWLHKALLAANRLGQLNCFLSDGKRLFCYHDAAGYKGLHLCHLPGEASTIADSELKIDLGKDGDEGGYAIATQPFEQRQWQDFQPGELIVFDAGKIRFSSHGRAIDAGER